MKRIRVNSKSGYRKAVGEQIPSEINSLSERLQLLYQVPLSYLVPEPSFLPLESIRFFYIDENYIKAMLNGATSIARNLKEEKRVDEAILPVVLQYSRRSSQYVRLSKVHVHHHKMLAKTVPNHEERRTGFLLRSSLIHRRKGIVIKGFHKENQLATLRIEAITPDIMIGIFDGELTSLTISEPKCGLRFGSHSSELKNPVLSIKDIGVPIGKEYFNINVNDKGRMDVLSAVGQINKVLKAKGEIQTDISSHMFAYELLLAAQRAEFIKKGEEKVE